MKSMFRTACLCLVAVLSLSSCIFSPKKDDPTVGTGEYKAPTSPENVIFNLEEAYRRKEIREYAKLLAPEFIFKFQLADLILIEDDFWTRDQDSTGTSNLFRTPEVSEIRISLTHGAAEDPSETGFDPGVKQVRINPTFLEVDETGGTTWQVDGDIQDMFFRRGDLAAGEDTTRWFIIEWRDIPDPSGAPQVRLDTAGEPAPGAANPEVQPVSWGRLRQILGTR